MKFRLLLLFLFFRLASFGQEVVFCESVNDVDGTPVKPSSYFIISNNGGTLMLLLKLDKLINSKSLKIDLYIIDEESKKEVFHNTLQAKPEPHYTWIKKEITFYKAGEYTVYIYDETDRLLGVGKVRIVLS